MTAIEKHNADKINELHQNIEATLNKTLSDAIEAGRLLMETKAKLAHGQFTGWVNSNLAFTDRTARSYMKLYENRHKIEGVSSISDAYKMLAPPKTETVSDLDNTIEDIEKHLSEIGIKTLFPEPGQEIELCNFSPMDAKTDFEILTIKHSEKHPGYLDPSVMRIAFGTDYGYEVYNKRGGLKLTNTEMIIMFYMQEFNFKKTADFEIRSTTNLHNN